MHKPSGIWKLGLAFSLLSALSFGVLPIALKGILNTMDAFTLTWYRFVMAGALLAILNVRPNKFSWSALPGFRLGVLIVVAGALMSVNFLCYLLGLAYVSPSTAQVVIQLAPLFLLLGSLVVYKESFSRGQWIGLFIMVFGLALFFNQRLTEMLSRLTNDTIGALLIMAAAFTWAIYGLMQKRLLLFYSSGVTLLLFYIVDALIFLPFASPNRIFDLTGPQLGLLGGCGLASALSYIGFAEALNHWEATRVSAMLALVPIITVVSVRATNTLWPEVIPPESLSLLSIAGALFVVAGSMATALLRQKK